ncbi:MAG: sigma-E processing peptidase SpoIIGA [Pelotomaculum sp.]|uniref:Sporulation sigma-E factor-processing peptidase n=1 Tax=Pelotomaculum thermopropionicum (strain DSM 13744 / JCM 10971 / SI) TaxID=370438 RepID=A5D169_PELTS|nr:sigma-E processing peptidase SpoIIGA [Pelotomaculum sp.]BAF60028.1 peptidase_U4, Sporulation factor SpoIIGA [Pelotomaculum thermopropionicum SI]
MAAYTVYLDQVFLGNAVMNYAILWAASKLSRTPASRGRLVAGACLGAAYSLSLFVPGMEFFLSAWFKAAFSVVIAAAVFAPLPPVKFLTCLGCFYLASFVLGGLVFGMIFFTHQGRVAGSGSAVEVIAEHFWPGIVLGLAAFWTAGRGFSALVKKGCFDGLFKIPLSVKSEGKQVKLEALLDTGNHLKDPLTRHPVVVVEYAALKPLLPPEVQACFEKEGEPDVWQILNLLGEKRFAGRFSAVPFQSLSRIGGLMVGYRPDEVIIEQKGRQLRAEKVVLAIYHSSLDPGNSYHALVGPELIGLG